MSSEHAPSLSLWFRLSCLFLICGGALQVVCGASNVDIAGHAWGLDDAFISYRYAWNMAHGHGLVFNPGEVVEGYSNLLYVLLLTPFCLWVPLDGIYFVACLWNLVFALAALFVLRDLAERSLSTLGAYLLLLGFALCPTLWVWVGSGMETPLVLLIQLGLWRSAVLLSTEEDGSVVGLCVWAALSVLVRADGFISPGLVLVFLAFRGAWRPVRALVWTLVVSFGGVVIWRLAYYGYPLPNTYYVKVSGPVLERLSQGWAMLRDVSWQQRIGLFLPGLLFAFAVTLRRGWSKGVGGLFRAQSLPVMFSVGLLGYWLYVGGDVFFERFLLVLFPMGLFLSLWCLLPRHTQEASERTVVSWRRWTALAFGVLVLVMQLSLLWQDPRLEWRFPSEKYDRWQRLGEFLHKHHPKALLAIDAAGKVPFFSKLRTVDMLGLNDLTLGHRPTKHFWAGHNKYDPKYVLSRKPDLIAAWLLPNGDMMWGLKRAMYRRAGYRIRYLVFARPKAPRFWLLNTQKLPLSQILRLQRRGFQYAVLERVVPAPTTRPSPPRQ